MNETHLIDGAMGRPHVNALDVRMHNAAMFGNGVYITEGLDGLPVTVVDANTVSVGRGVMLINGARITQEEKIDLTIESGSQGMNRNDLLVATYTYDAANTRCEDVNLEIVTGTPTADTATDPDIHSGTLLDINSADLVEGVSTVQVPIARITLTGTTVGTPVILAKKFGTIQDIRDSVSRTPLTVTDVKSGFAVKAWRMQLGIQIDVTGSSNTLIQSAEEWGYEVAKIPAAASLSLCGLVGMMWTDGANSNDLMWFHMSNGSLRVDFKSKTKDWPKTIHCDGIMAYS